MTAHRRRTTLAMAVVAVVVLPQCSAEPEPEPGPAAPPPSSTVAPPPPPPEPAVPPPPAVHPVTAAELGPSWRPGCPLPPERLRRVEIDHVGFDDQTHRGELIVHEDLVAEVTEIFGQLYRLRYPIEKMHTVERYPNADDELSMRDNNTSAFNCRDIPGSGSWSWHAYGRAIDLNPLINPYIDAAGDFQPDNAEVYLDRDRIDPGLLHDGDPAVLAFTDRGWRWGGHWRTPKDYQHFERR
ncbi:M15 family metallopeptidase [Mycolicibacterium pulveris]|uniref:M15 family metallopeptidase n=1 Tax=Mycolicibacterium pulveris TaxID=36813 RepID=UPI003CF348D2